MKQTLHRFFAAALTGVVALLYLWIGASAHGGERLLGIAGGLLILAALAAAPRSRTAALVLLAVGSLPLAVVTWWSIATPVLAVVAQPPVRPPRPDHDRARGSGLTAPDRRSVRLAWRWEPARWDGTSGPILAPAERVIW
jgi:hypothetical protein